MVRTANCGIVDRRLLIVRAFTYRSREKKYGRAGPKAVFSPKQPTVLTNTLAISWIRQQELANIERKNDEIHPTDTLEVVEAKMRGRTNL